MDLLKQDFAAGLEGLQQLLKASDSKAALISLTEDRNINRYRKKQVIYSEGNHPSRLYYVLKGKVKAYRTNDDGKELITELFNTGDFLGYVALLEGTAYKDTTETLEDTELAVVPKEDFAELISNNSAVAQKFIQMLAKNVSAKEEQLLRLAYNSLRKKVADALLLLEKKYRQNNEEHFVIIISREGLASIAGTATESLIRTLSDFRSEKLIDIKSGGIEILNHKKLENLLN